jgi:hypothetical protein
MSALSGVRAGGAWGAIDPPLASDNLARVDRVQDGGPMPQGSALIP